MLHARAAPLAAHVHMGILRTMDSVFYARLPIAKIAPASTSARVVSLDIRFIMGGAICAQYRIVRHAIQLTTV